MTDTTTNTSSHLPPQNIEAEEAILGAMMIELRSVEIATEYGLRAEDFYRPSHRLIFTAILEAAQKEAPDELTVINRLKQLNQLNEVGGNAAILSLTERVPAVANAKAYAQEVRSQAILRGLVEDGHEIARLGYEHPDEPENLVVESGRIIDARADRSARNQSTMTTLADQWPILYDQMTERFESGVKISGLQSGFTDIDVRLGGYQDGRLYIGAGRPGMGKSIFGSSVIEGVTYGSGVDTLTFCFEMGPTEQAARSLARAGRMSLHRIANSAPVEGDSQLAHNAIANHLEAARMIHIDGSPKLSIDQIRQRARRLDRTIRRNSNNTRRLRMILIDYLQQIEWPKGCRDEYSAITKISAALKALALEMTLPIIALAQLSRKVEERPDKRPVLSDLRGSGQIEQDADAIQFLYRPEYYLKENTPPEWQGIVEVNTAKWRNGEVGADRLGFIGGSARMANLTEPKRVVA